MTTTILIVGAGPAAAAAAMAAVEHGNVDVTVLDIGLRLEADRAEVVRRLSQSPPGDWALADRQAVSTLPAATAVKGPPEKRSYGSDFPFRSGGQLEGITAEPGANGSLVSAAYGGFSNLWGAQVMPFTAATFARWPISATAMESSYASVLRNIPFTGETDDLARLFPLLVQAQPLPALSDRTVAVMERARQHRERLAAHGVTMGLARLAMASSECVLAGMCLTGCPYSLIYSASHTLDALRQSGRIKYRSGLLAFSVSEDDGQAHVQAKDVRSQEIHRFSADRVLLACGAIGTSRLVLGSLGLYGREVPVAEAAQFLLPFISRRPVSDPRTRKDFTLNQFNMVVDLDGAGYDLAQLHFYTYNPTFLEALPRLLRASQAECLRRPLLRRLSVALGYLPSWVSPQYTLTAQPSREVHALPELVVRPTEHSFRRNRFLREVLRRVTAVAPRLDLWPALPQLLISAQGKSYHWGGTFPHAERRDGLLTTDHLGRVESWDRVHLVDASVFPTVPATTFTLTIMANAHRITRTTLASFGS